MKAILTYHSIDASGSVISTSQYTFRRHLHWLDATEICVTDIPTLLALPDTVDAVAITVDDGFSNFASSAWPLLRRRGFPVTLFVVTDFVGRHNDWDRNAPHVPCLSLLGWEELGRLQDEGVELGSHGCRHPRLSIADPDVLIEEVHASADRLWTKTGVRPRSFAYPFGSVIPSVAEAIGTVYDFACTTELRLLHPTDSPLLLPRLDAYYFRKTGSLEAWGTRVFRRRLQLLWAGRRLRRLVAVN